MSINLNVDKIFTFCFLFVHQEDFYTLLDIYLVDKKSFLHLLLGF